MLKLDEHCQTSTLVKRNLHTCRPYEACLREISPRASLRLRSVVPAANWSPNPTSADESPGVMGFPNSIDPEDIDWRPPLALWSRMRQLLDCHGITRSYVVLQVEPSPSRRAHELEGAFGKHSSCMAHYPQSRMRQARQLRSLHHEFERVIPVQQMFAGRESELAISTGL